MDKRVWGEGADSFLGKNPLAKLLASATSGRLFSPTISATQTTAQDRHTDTQTQTGSQNLTSAWDCHRHSTKLAPSSPGAWDSRKSRRRMGETGTPSGVEGGRPKLR